MNKLNILKVIDVWGWAYDNVNREQKKYSAHNIYIKKLFDLDINKINSTADIIYFHAPNIEYDTEMNIINQIDKTKVKIIGAYGGETELKYNHSDLIVSISYPFIKKLNEFYPNKSVIFLPESIDTDFWNIKKQFNKESFIPGYAGKLHLPLKRSYLLDKLDYTVLKQAQWGEKYFIKNRNPQPMIDFYKKIDVLLITSKTECMPRVVLEAMACGIPIISTDVGCIKMLLDEEWIVPNESEDLIISEINKKLKLLKKYISLRKEIGERNKKYIEQYFSWKKNSVLWDDVFTALYLNDYEKIKSINNNFIEPFKNLYKND